MIIFKPHQAIEIIAQFIEPKVIVEAGAFRGHDSIRLAEKWPDATIYAFEPVPEIFEQLVTKTKAYTNIHRFKLALSNKNGTATFHIGEKPQKPGVPSQSGSLLAPKERLSYSTHEFKSKITVPTITLDSWALKQNISHIDLAWLDMQGHELAVLQASPNMLQNIKAIYCEVGFIEGYQGQPKHEEIKSWLENHGFKEVARDFENKSDWFFGNALFIKN